MSLSQSFSQKIGNVRPLNPCPSLDIDFANGGYVNTGGFANQESVGSANFKIGAFNGPDPIFTRATAATFRGSNGLIQYAPENLLQYSEQFDNAYWSRNNLNTTGSPAWINVAVSPDGATTAEKIIPDTSASPHFVRKTAITSSTGIVHTASIYAKQAGYRYIGLSDGTSAQSVYDLQTGAIISSDAGITAYPAVNMGNGWWRLSISYAAITSRGLAAYVWDNQTKTTFAGDGTSGIYIWGAQLERSSTARPYISTTSAERYGPRFEYDLSGNPLGLLMEEQSSNGLLYSEQFDVSLSWIPTNLAVAANQLASPSGLVNSDKLTTNGVAAIQRISQNSTQTGASTYSIYVKAGTASFIQVIHGSSANVYANFNVSTGAAGNVGSSATSSITSVGNGWYRCVVSATIGSVSSWHLYIVQSNTAAYGAAFSATVANLYVWGAQLDNRIFATSYIPTIGSTGTRSADTLTSTVGAWYNNDEGSFVVRGDRLHSPTLNAAAVDALFEMTNATTLAHAHYGDGSSESYVVDDQLAVASSASAAGINVEFAFGASYSIATDDISVALNGAVLSAAYTDTITAPNSFTIGFTSWTGTNAYWNGHIKSFRYYPKALPDKIGTYTS